MSPSVAITARPLVHPPGTDLANKATVEVAVGRVTLLLSRAQALRLWVVLGSATMPDAERSDPPESEWVDAAVAMLLDPSAVAHDPQGASEASLAGRVSELAKELDDVRESVTRVGASCDREVCLYGVWLRASRRGPPSDVVLGQRMHASARIARAFHYTYERLAPEHGYETRKESSVPWHDVPENNRALMVATVRSLLRDGTIIPGDLTDAEALANERQDGSREGTGAP